MLKVLILEDNADSRAILERLLTEHFPELSAYAVGTKEEAERLLSEEEFDLYLLDVNLDAKNREDASGLSFAREVRQKRGAQFTPIVMITSVASLEMAAYREVHCYQYIVKPFVRETVLSIVRNLLEGRRQERRDSFVFRRDGVNYRVDCADLLYVKAVPRGVALVLRREEIRVLYLTLRRALEQLPDYFVQCHRMYVVNTTCIEYCDFANRLLKLRGCDTQLEIGGAYKSPFKERLGASPADRGRKEDGPAARDVPEGNEWRRETGEQEP